MIKAPYFIAFVRPLLEEVLGENLLYRGGLTIKTTIKESWQDAAKQALIEGLAALERRHRTPGTAGEQIDACSSGR